MTNKTHETLDTLPPINKTAIKELLAIPPARPIEERVAILEERLRLLATYVILGEVDIPPGNQ